MVGRKEREEGRISWEVPSVGCRYSAPVVPRLGGRRAGGLVEGAVPSAAASEANALVAEALERNPELAAARSEASALATRASAAGVLSDPMLSVGYENDGSAISLGTEPMSRLIFAAQQASPFPGKPVPR